MKYSTLFSKVLKAAILVFSVMATGAAFCQDTTLQGFAPFPFGASINPTLLQNNSSYRAVVTKEFNSLTPENAMKMGSIIRQ